MTAPVRDDAPFLYRAGRFLGRAVLASYFRKIHRHGEEHLDAPGPAVLAANHPQSITDALVLGVGTRRMVHFLAHGGLFKSSFRAAVLRGAGVVPVYRAHETEGASEKNVETFRACRDVLAAGGVIGIFPEGVSRDALRLERLKTGAARIAFEAEDAAGFRLGVRVVPVGIHFETPRRYRSRVLLRAGEPLRPSEYAEAYRADPRKAVEQFTRDLQEALAARVVHLERPEWRGLVEDIEALFGESLLGHPGLVPAEPSLFTREAMLSGGIARAVEFFEEREPGRLLPLARDLETYRMRREALRVPDELLAASSLPSIRGEVLRSLVPLVLGFLPALWGRLWCGLPHWVVRTVVARRNPDPSKIHWTKLWVGLLAYLLYYPPLLVLAVRLLGPWPAAAFGATLIPAGFFAMAYFRYRDREKARLRAGWLALTRRSALEEARAMRRRLILQMEALLGDYLRLAPDPGAPGGSA